MTQAIELTRKELYDLVWQMPLWKLAPKLGISDRGLAKLCHRHEIPRPPMGHWQRVKESKLPSQDPLPFGSKETTLYFRGPSQDDTQHLIKAHPSVLEAMTWLEKPYNIAQAPILDKKLHPAVKQALTELKNAWPDQYGLKQSGGSSPFITTSPEMAGKAAQIAHHILVLASKRGFTTSSNHIHCHGELVPFKIREKLNRLPSAFKKKSSDKTELHFEPSGLLLLSIEGYYSEGNFKRNWTSSPSEPLESHLDAFMLSVVKASVSKQYRKRHEAEARAEQEKQRQIKAFRQQEIEGLEAHCVNWVKANRLSEFLNTVEQSGCYPTHGFTTNQDWLTWARRYALQLDPLDL
ncbi:MAG: hypothetical protein KC475_00305 [Cyanobacteria bacterium HKST-UBA03]|nr:hypothetical protein [Cyanobacteria bacterium HKST-UBA03]